MGESRESRPSEKIFRRIWDEIPRLSNCVWHGPDLLENAQEYVDSIKENLDFTIVEMKREATKGL